MHHVRVVVELDKEINAFAAWCPELPGCTSCGDTEAEALINIREAIDLYLEPSDIKLPPEAKVTELAL